ncbi:zinc finger protein 271-like [Maniola jurtina]|uniref:zinc finger protein 271-like n=1 Tax=Maniola jurtina TaxID=191418 RepID=UPI001E68FC51|nr:zinc finger protein 271-like [Maniola jurtina]XP_045783540.1 zinc finger protein 271-like [Maniola jurtina]XP_045783541.1 zinc finger protein 271-like [Maniola jurtina]
MEQQATASMCDTGFLIELKEEMLDDPEWPEVSLVYDKNFIVPKDELSNTHQHLVTADSDQPMINIVKPIKTERILSKDITELQKLFKSSEDTKTTFCNTDALTLCYMRTHVKWEPSQAEESLDNHRPVDDKKTEHESQEFEDLLLEKRFECCHCEYTTNYKVHLIKHLRTKHSSTKPKKTPLLLHMRTHTGEQSYSCKYCDYKCSNSGRLKLHMMTHTGEKPYHCKHCDYKCLRSGGLTVHMRIHTGEKPYHCEVCDYKCVHKGNLKKHMRIHTGEKRYHCEHCDHKFRTKGKLKIHTRIHTAKKPCRCQYCDYQVTQSSKRKDKGTYTASMTYFRKYCGFECSQPCTLKYHMMRHTSEKSYHCKLCDFSCLSQSGLQLHMSTHPYICAYCDGHRTAPAQLPRGRCMPAGTVYAG